MKEIYRSFAVLEVGGDEAGYIVYQLDSGLYQVEYHSLEVHGARAKFRVEKALNWEDGAAVSDARIDVTNAVIKGQVYWHGKWYSTKMIEKIMKDHQSYDWRQFV